MNNYIPILKEYQDKVYVYNVLCVRTYEYYNNVKSFINIPLLVSASCMTILNSGTFEAEQLKIPNIIINASTTLMLALINNFKVAEKSQVFRQLSLKYVALLHDIEHKINTSDTVDADDIRDIMRQYDDLLSQNEFVFPERIKNKVKRMFKDKKSLPVILNDNDSQASPPSSKQPSLTADNYAL